MNATVRPAAVAGMFYPGDQAGLRAELEACLAPHVAVTSAGHHRPDGLPVPPAPTFPDIKARIKALIVPHAGYIYSGSTAGQAYALLAPQAAHIRRVVLLGPCHRVAVRGLAAPTVDAFDTPLGRIPLDRAAIDALADLPQVVASDAAHAQEHSLEVQLPFLQTVLGDFSLVPLAVGQASTDEVAEVLARLWGGPETLIVISSDLSHFHTYRDAQGIDKDTVRYILAGDGLTSHEQACGALPINGLLAVAKQKALAIELIAHCNSGDTAGDKSRVVGYASFMFHEPDLGTALLVRARNAIAGQLGLATQPEPGHPQLAAPGASFVTLTKQGQLRGCIGSLEAHRRLDDDVRANALAAALRDPRFPPVTAAEWPVIKVEVSLLSTPEPMTFSDEADALHQLRPGIDGVILQAGHLRSTFLPQVWDQLPNPRQFMAHLKQKAGLSANDWPAGLHLARYQVRKWTEAPPLNPAMTAD